MSRKEANAQEVRELKTSSRQPSVGSKQPSASYRTSSNGVTTTL
jgi:hypothetical protein